MKISNVSSVANGVKPSDVFCSKFLNSGSEDMRVNGSVTPVDFTLETLPIGQNIMIQSIDILLAADDVLDLGKFGSVAELVNGLQFSCDSNLRTFKNNGDVFLVASNIFSSTAGGGSGTYTLISAKWDFTEVFGGNGGVLLDASNVKLTVNDDLTTLPYFKVACHALLLEDN